MTIPDDYQQLTPQDVEDAAGDLQLTTDQTKALAFYNGDHWQEADGYRGPLPDGPDYTEERAIVLTALAREWTSENKIREVVNRHRSGVLGRPPSIQLARSASSAGAPLQNGARRNGAGLADRIARRNGAQAGPAEPAAEDPEADELAERLTDWSQRADVVEAVDAAIARLLTIGRAPLRFYVPPTSLAPDGTLTPLDPADPLAGVYLEAPPPQNAGIYTHPVSRQPLGIFSMRDDAGSYLEWTFVDLETGETVYTTTGPDGDTSARLALARRLPIHEIRRDALITPQIMSNQRQLNLAVTMRSRNVTAAGFVERTLINASIDGEYVTGPDGKERFRPYPMIYGTGVTNALQGLPQLTAEGHTTYTDPQIVYKDPTPPAAFNDTRDAAYRAILEEAHQLHYLIAGDATPSGAARLAAMADHVTALLETKKAIDIALTWMLTTAAAYLENLTRRPGAYTATYRIRGEAKLDVGPISADSSRATRENYAAGLLSQRSAMEWIGVENVDEELEQINAERPAVAPDADIDATASRLAETIDRIRNRRPEPGQEAQETNTEEPRQ